MLQPVILTKTRRLWLFTQTQSQFKKKKSLTCVTYLKELIENCMSKSSALKQYTVMKSTVKMDNAQFVLNESVTKLSKSYRFSLVSMSFTKNAVCSGSSNQKPI